MYPITSTSAIISLKMSKGPPIFQEQHFTIKKYIENLGAQFHKIGHLLTRVI